MNIISRLRQHKAYHYVKVMLGVAAAILAVTAVMSVSVDLGPAVRERAEKLGQSQWKRPIHIGRLSIRLFNGHILVEDFRIDGLEPADRPFFTAKRLEVALDWSTLLNRSKPTEPEMTITAVDLTDWQMLVEKWPNRTNFVKFTSDDETKGPKRFTTTLRYLRAWRGRFTYEDHEAPWSIVAPNIDLNMGNLPRYHGTATFTGGTVAIQDAVPFSASMKASYVIDGGRVHLERIEFDSDGAKTVATGDVDFANWPEQSYQFKSHVQLMRMRQIFFKNERWELGGESDFTGTFHLFKGGRDLSGSFTTPLFAVDDYRFKSVNGSLRWTPTLLNITSGTAKAFCGDARFSYSIQPLGSGERPTARFATDFTGVDIAAVSDFEQLKGLRFAGTGSADSMVLEWPLGRFAEHRGSGRLTIVPPPGVPPMTSGSDPGEPQQEWGPFAPAPLPAHLPIAGELTYRFDPDLIYIDSGRFATERTHVTFEGTTAWGGDSRLAFHATSSDWQESDQLLAGIMTDFGAPTGPVTFGGRGQFEGTMTGPFREPKVEGLFSGERLRGFDTVWGTGNARIVVEHNYVQVTDGIVKLDDSEMRFDGLFSLGFPRDDDKDEIDARIRVTRRDLDSLRHAFGIDEYPLSGALSGEFQLTGGYLRPSGFGAIALENWTAYGEPLQTATASLRFDGTGVRLDGISVEKGGGTITGAAFVGWDATYSFNFDGRRIPIDKISKLTYARAPLSGIGDFSATGSATFEQPRNDYRFRVNDLFVGEEGVGQVTGSLALRGTELSGEIDAASPRLAITATGRVALTSRSDSDVTIRFHDMSLDPYVRPYVPSFSPFATAVASGSIRVSGPLTDLDRVAVDATVDSLDMRLFDYALKNATPIRASILKRDVTIEELRLTGVDTELRLGGRIDLAKERVALQATGGANLGILQGFFHDVRGSGRANLTAAVDGPLREPAFSGRATVTDGRIRHFSLPSSLDSINGVLSFDPRGVRFDELTARMGGGDVRFGGRIAFEGYLPGELNVTVRGQGVQLRPLDGVRSVVDADLLLRGNFKTPMLGGTVTVRNAVYSKPIAAPETILDFAVRRPLGNTAGAADTVATTTIPLRFDLQILVPSTLTIANNLARGRASADLTLRGTYDRPAWLGHAEVERGELSYKGKRYRVTKGNVDFTNPARLEPFFDVQAETNVRVGGQNYRLEVGVSGTTQKLVPSLGSDPPLPAADILALLFSDVRRTDDAELRPLINPNQRQNDLLSASAAETIAKPISDASKVVERAFGVDTFQLTPFLTDVNSSQSSRLNPTARLTVGKRISDRVFLTFSRSLASSINDQIILLEYDASERVSWMLSRNEDQQTYALEFRVRRTF